jgi:hypothetical protein
MKSAVIAAAALVGLGWAGGANAAVLDLGSTSPLTLSGVPGLTTLTFSPSPDTDSRLANNVGTSDFANLFLPQNSTQVGLGVQALFGLSTAPTFVSSPGDAVPGVNTATGPFNFAAIHQGTAEIVLEFATPQTSVTLGGFTDALSTVNFYSGAVGTPRSGVPEPSTWAMMLLGFAGLGVAAFRRTGIRYPSSRSPLNEPARNSPVAVRPR